MEVYCKSTIDKNDQKRSISLPCMGLEFYLEKKFCCFTKEDIENIPINIANVKVVHSPIVNREFLTLTSAVLGDNLNVLNNCFILAQRVADYWNHRVLLIIHNTMSYQEYIDWSLFLQKFIVSSYH